MVDHQMLLRFIHLHDLAFEVIEPRLVLALSLAFAAAGARHESAEQCQRKQKPCCAPLRFGRSRHHLSCLLSHSRAKAGAQAQAQAESDGNETHIPGVQESGVPGYCVM